MMAAGLAVISTSGHAITFAASTVVTDLYPPTLRATIFGWLYLAGSIGRVVAQVLVAALTPLIGGVAATVGALGFLGLPATALFFWFVREPVPVGSQEVHAAEILAPRRPVFVRAALVMLSLLLAAGVMEGLVRRVVPRGVMVPWQDDIRGVTVPKLSVQGRFAMLDRFDTTITIHNRFRSAAEVPMTPPPHQVRIAVLGDNATFGWGSEDDQTYPAALERNVNGTGRARVNVLNAGVIGSGTAEQALWYDLWVKQFNPAVVVLTVAWNDVDDDMRGALFEERDGTVRPRPLDVLERGLRTVRLIRALANGTPGFSWLSQHSQLLSLVRQAPTGILLTSHARSVAGRSDGPSRHPSLEPHELSHLRGTIRWLRGRLAPSTRFAVVFLPSAELFSARPGALEVLTKSKQVVDALEQAAAADHFDFLSLQPEVEKHPRPERLYFARDPHPNAAGNEAIAAAVARFLVDRHLVDPL